MELKEAYEKYKKFKVPSLSVIREKANQYSKTSLVIVILLVVFLALALQYVPHFQVAQFNITNQKDLADAENSYRATLAQMLGGIAVLFGLYFAWGNLTNAREGQITERFTRAIDQLGNRKPEIRLGGIYALERIARESDKDYWQIMEILTAYVRKNSSIKADELKDVALDIQATLTVIKRRKYSFTHGENNSLDLSWTNLQHADLEFVNLYEANLYGANLSRANLNNADLSWANLIEANLSDAVIAWSDLIGTFFIGANLTGASFCWSGLSKADFEGAILSGAVFEGVDLREAENLTIEQLSKVKTLHGSELDEGLLIPLMAKYPALFEEIDDIELIPLPFRTENKKGT